MMPDFQYGPMRVRFKYLRVIIGAYVDRYLQAHQNRRKNIVFLNLFIDTLRLKTEETTYIGKQPHDLSNKILHATKKKIKKFTRIY